MIASQNQRNASDHLATKVEIEPAAEATHTNNLGLVKNLNIVPPSVLQNRIITHHPKAGLNPVVDAASYLFSVLGKLKALEFYRQYTKLQKELIQELNIFQETVKSQGYNAEYVLVCRYILCATFDDIISNTPWGGQGQWEHYSLLLAYNQDPMHQDKFFNILDRALKEPALYIDLMELIYICLSLGYKGQYRATEHNLYQLEQITHNLYQHIRAYRGSFNKSLSPTPIKPTAAPKEKATAEAKSSAVFILFVAACIVLTIFISLGYLMDVISNEAYKNINPTEDYLTEKVTVPVSE